MKEKSSLLIRALVCLLAAAMVFIGLNLPPVTARAEQSPACIDLEAADTWSYFGTDWSGCAGSVAEEGTRVVITADSFGWNGEWGLQYAVQNLGLEDNAEYLIEFDIASTIDKKVFVKINDEGEGFLTRTLELKAGESCRFSETVACGVWAEKQIIFGLGQMAGEETNLAGVITIENMRVVKPGEEQAFINLQAEHTEFYFGTEWSGAAGEGVEDGAKAVIDFTSFGWNGEWGAQYTVSDLALIDNAVYVFEFDIVSTIDKRVVVKVNDEGEGFLFRTLELRANEPLHFEETVACGTWSPKQVIFGLGQMAGEDADMAGVITIGNMVFTEIRGEDEAEAGEYDFARAAENLAGDYPDPGKAPVEGYELIWADEFDGSYGSAAVDAQTGLNLDNWSYQLGDGTTDCGNPGWGNRELQAYTDRAENIAVNEDLSGDGTPDGLLRITAAHEAAGYVYGTESSKNYTSARIRTTRPDSELFNATYGYIEARMSLPAAQGAWPAFWMLPQSTRIYGGWPVSGELDIMETVGSFGDGIHNRACSTLHWGVPDHVYKGSGYTALRSDITCFHTYGVDWKPGEITWYYDGEPIYTIRNWASGKPGASDKYSFDAPFDQPFYLLLNLAVDSGQFGGAANRASFDGKINMYVDYVRVYQAKEGYAAFADPAAGEAAGGDWQDYAGQNQIAEITAIGENMGDESTVDKAGWFLSCNANGTGGAATASLEDGWAVIDISEAGTQDYSVQLIGHYDAKAGYAYRVSFDAYAGGNMAGRTVICDAKEWRGWSAYGILSFSLEDEAVPVSYTFMQNEDFENCRIEFNLGARGTGSVHIGNVRVEIVDPASLGGESDFRKPLANGNVIYNGSFDQGSRHTGYWRTLDGTALTVPRYTTRALSDADVSVVDVASRTNHEGVEGGVKYYERRARISGGSMPGIYQPGFRAPAGRYALTFDMYCDREVPVLAKICTADEDGSLGDCVLGASIVYGASDGLRHFTWNFELEGDIENAALCLQFDTAEDVEVQIDNVFLINAELGESLQPHPVNSETSWSGDTGTGSGYPLEKKENVYTARAVSGGTWYSPQFMSDTFTLVADREYVFRADFKLEGKSNRKVKYIIQEAGGSWHVFTGVTEVTYDPAAADEDGFCRCECRFIANATMDTVHVIFGLGDSEASGAQFSFRNVTLDMADAVDLDGNAEGDDWRPLP